MKFALFLGCNIPARVTQYADSAMAVLEKANVDIAEIPAFNCCGYPVQNFDFHAFILSAARNLAIAEQHGLNMLVLCKCCFGALKKGEHLLKENRDLKSKINQKLAEEKLTYEGRFEVKHFLSVLYHDVGVEKLKEHISKPYDGLVIAASNGCHAMRPSRITQFDDPVAPKMFNELVEITGAYSVYWESAQDCCGAPLMGINDDFSESMTAKKIFDGKKAGAQFISTACPYCHMQFETVQNENTNREILPSILYSQLLGLAMGIDKDILGIQKNRLDISNVTSFFKLEDVSDELPE